MSMLRKCIINFQNFGGEVKIVGHDAAAAMTSVAHATTQRMGIRNASFENAHREQCLSFELGSIKATLQEFYNI
ncbi:hypothetical protein BOTCAL_0012g00420 [Botryotinia calthae]|uniref:Uncharacterized protein n=1 Tax=Botryotinia calthae TaxID=38488 RepID=A0A4Y8DGB0_9HELO|nr:hypothetical protein BOTCAL_0012g00420 [Botryotinia calthae]